MRAWVCERQHGQSPSILTVELSVLLMDLSSPGSQARWPMLRTNLSASSHNGDPDSLDQSISHHAREQFLLSKQRGSFGRASQRLSIIDNNPVVPARLVSSTANHGT